MQLSTIPALMTTDPRAVREVIRQAARHGPSAVEEGTGLISWAMQISVVS
jgi:hypothetical protein